MLSPTLTNQGPTETSKSGPSVTSTPARSRLLLLGVCHEGEAGAASPDGRHHQSQLRRVCHPMVLSLGYTENYWGFQGYSPFQLPGYKRLNPLFVDTSQTCVKHVYDYADHHYTEIPSQTYVKQPYTAGGNTGSYPNHSYTEVLPSLPLRDRPAAPLPDDDDYLQPSGPYSQVYDHMIPSPGATPAGRHHFSGTSQLLSPPHRGASPHGPPIPRTVISRVRADLTQTSCDRRELTPQGTTIIRMSQKSVKVRTHAINIAIALTI